MMLLLNSKMGERQDLIGKGAIKFSLKAPIFSNSLGVAKYLVGLYAPKSCSVLAQVQQSGGRRRAEVEESV